MSHFEDSDGDTTIIKPQSKIKEGLLIGIRFGLLNDKGLLQRSVAKLSDDPSSCKKNHSVLESATDPRLGPGSGTIACTSCAQDPLGCAGHIMHMKLSWPCASGSFLPYLDMLATIFCYKCSSILVPESKLKSFRKQNIPEHVGYQNAIRDIYKEAKKTRICGQETPDDIGVEEDDMNLTEYSLTPAEIIKRNTKDQKKGCGARNPIIWKRLVDVLIRPIWKQKNPPKITMYHLLSMFRNVKDEDAHIVGFNAPAASLSALVSEYFMITPMLIRPPRNRKDQDDLTQRTEFIIKVNHSIKSDLRSGNLSLTVQNTGIPCAGTSYFEVLGEDIYTPEERPRRSANAPKQQPLIPKHLAPFFELQRQVAGFTHSKLNQKKDLDYGRTMGCISDAFKASDNGENKGMIRQNITGRRSNGSARTVITPDSSIPIDGIGVPIFICKNLTKEVVVTKFNYHKLLEKVLRGNVYPGASKITRDSIEYQLPGFAHGGLKMNDIVHCHLVASDKVLINRQPSLHHWSTMCHKVIPMAIGMSFRLNPCVCDPYGADFDGDEMNLLVLPDEMAEAESVLMEVGRNLFRNGKLIVKLIQHACKGCYTLTKPGYFITRDYAYQLVMISNLGDYIFDRLNNVIFPISGQDFLSRLIGKVFYPGGKQLKKKDINYILGNLIQWYDNGVDILSGFCRLFETHAANITTSLSYHDVFVKKPKFLTDEINIIKNQIIEIENEQKILSGTEYPGDQVLFGKVENYVSKLLDQIRDKIGSYVRGELLERNDNPLLILTESGAKGTPAAIISTVGILGQQKNRQGKRLKCLTPHEADTLTSHGFVNRCLTEGLRALEMYYHAAAARDGLVDGAVLIKRIGYLFRRLYKALEDCFISFNNSVRTHTGLMVIASFGFDTTYLNQVYVKSIDINDFETMKQHFYYPYGKLAGRELESILHVKNCILKSKKKVHRSCALPIQWNMLPEVIRECSDDQYCLTKQESDLNDFADLVRLTINDCWKRMVIEDYLPSYNLLLLSFRENLCAKHIIEVLKVRRTSQLVYLMQHVARCLVKNLSELGTPIGPNVAQDFSAPLEQDSLKSFHRGGKESALNGGLDRIEEILTLPSEIRTPSMRLYPINQDIFDPLFLVQVRLSDITSGWVDHIFHDSSTEQQISPEIIREEIDENNVVKFVYNITCCFLLKKHIMIEHQIPPRKVMEFMLRHPELNTEDIISCDCAKLDDEIWWVCIQIASNSTFLTTDKKSKKTKGNVPLAKIIQVKKKRKTNKKPKKPKKTPIKKKNDYIPLPMTLAANIYYKFTIRDSNRLLAGVKNVIDFFETQEIVNIVDEDKKTGILTFRKEKRNVIVTRGSNLYEISVNYHSLFLTNLSQSNDLVNEIYELYGIDAACKAIEDELCRIMLTNDASVARSHIHVIASFMCLSGRPMAMTYAGMMASGANKFKLCAYEKPLSGFFDVGTSGHENNLTGLSECVMVGKPFCVGTGSVHLIASNDEVIEVEKNLVVPVHTIKNIPKSQKDQLLTISFKPSTMDYIQKGGYSQPFAEILSTPLVSAKKQTPARSNKNLIHLPVAKKRPPKASTYQKKIKKPKPPKEMKRIKKNNENNILPGDESKKLKTIKKYNNEEEEESEEKIIPRVNSLMLRVMKRKIEEENNLDGMVVKEKKMIKTETIDNKTITKKKIINKRPIIKVRMKVKPSKFPIIPEPILQTWHYDDVFQPS